MIKIANVLVASDFGDTSAVAVAYGRELARTFGARLHVLHVVEPMAYADSEAAGADIARIQGDLETAAQYELDRIVTPEDREQLRAVTVIRTGTPAYEIVSYAKSTGVDVIIVGTHGRGFISHLLMGSVAEKVVRTAPCPVLTVRHPQHEFIRPEPLQAVESSQRM